MFLVSRHISAAQMVPCFTCYTVIATELKKFKNLVTVFISDENSWKSEAEIDMELFHQVYFKPFSNLIVYILSNSLTLKFS
jgi:hypothetical protein